MVATGDLCCLSVNSCCDAILHKFQVVWRKLGDVGSERSTPQSAPLYENIPPRPTVPPPLRLPPPPPPHPNNPVQSPPSPQQNAIQSYLPSKPVPPYHFTTQPNYVNVYNKSPEGPIVQHTVASSHMQHTGPTSHIQHSGPPSQMQHSGSSSNMQHTGPTSHMQPRSSKQHTGHTIAHMESSHNMQSTGPHKQQTGHHHIQNAGPSQHMGHQHVQNSGPSPHPGMSQTVHSHNVPHYKQYRSPPPDHPHDRISASTVTTYINDPPVASTQKHHHRTSDQNTHPPVLPPKPHDKLKSTYPQRSQQASSYPHGGRSLSQSPSPHPHTGRGNKHLSESDLRRGISSQRFGSSSGEPSRQGHHSENRYTRSYSDTRPPYSRDSSASRELDRDQEPRNYTDPRAGRNNQPGNMSYH